MIRIGFISFLAKMCSLAQESVSSSVETFLSSTMLTNQLITRTEFNQEINDTLARFHLKTPIAFARTLDLTRLLIHDNAIMEFPLSNWITLQDEQLQDQNLAFFSQSNVFIVQESNQSCSCATSSTCISPSIIFKDDGTVNYTIPGFAYGCYLFQSVLLSSLSCLYSLTCIAELRQYLDLRVGALEEYHATTGYPIQLNASATRFNVSDTIETLAYAMFIESWTSNVSYERYFNSCAPTSCTYTFHYRFDGMEMFTTFLSVFSGLSLAIRFVVPHAVRLLRQGRNRARIVPLW